MKRLIQEDNSRSIIPRQESLHEHLESSHRRSRSAHKVSNLSLMTRRWGPDGTRHDGCLSLTWCHKMSNIDALNSNNYNCLWQTGCSRWRRRGLSLDAAGKRRNGREEEEEVKIWNALQSCLIIDQTHTSAYFHMHDKCPLVNMDHSRAALHPPTPKCWHVDIISGQRKLLYKIIYGKKHFWSTG